MKTIYEDWPKRIDCEVSNPLNPYDEAGLRHNELMAQIESEGNPEMTLDDVFELCDKVLKETFKNELPPNYSSKENATPIINIETEEEYRNYINSLELSVEQKDNVFKLNDILFRYNGNNICEIIKSVKDFENALMKKYKPETMENVLISSSVGRFALAYWDSRVSNDNIEAKGFWKKLFTGIADSIGAVGGAGVGGLAGGITGAIGASAGFGSVWDIFAK